MEEKISDLEAALFETVLAEKKASRNRAAINELRRDIARAPGSQDVVTKILLIETMKHDQMALDRDAFERGRRFDRLMPANKQISGREIKVP